MAGTKPCPQSSSNHHSPSLLVLSLGGAVLHKLIHLLYQTILQQTEHPGASRVVLCQTKTAHHIVDGLGNPHFKMSDFLRERIGTHQYKAPRADGKQDFTIDEHLVGEFVELEVHQFDCCNINNKERIWGLFGDEDTLAHFEPVFLKYYMNSYHFPGAHTPTAEQFKTWYCPLIDKLISLQLYTLQPE